MRFTIISVAMSRELSEDSQARLERNPLRILDSKAQQDWPIVDSAPVIDEYLTPEAADFFERVTKRSMPPGSLGSARRDWSAGSIIIATLPSSSSPIGSALKGP